MSKIRVESEMLRMEVVRQGKARQIGRSNNTFRTVPYRVGRCDGEVFIIIDGTEPLDDRAATEKWIPLRPLLPLLEQWAREDAAALARGEGPIVRSGKHFEPALPVNSTMPDQMEAVLRNEGVLMAEIMVAVMLPGCPTDFSLRKSVLSPVFGLDDVVEIYLEPFDPLDVVDVPLDRIFNPEGVD